MKFRSRRSNPQAAISGCVQLVLLLKSQYDWYQWAHWSSDSYGDHLVFQRIYEGIDEEIDQLAELVLADREVNPDLEVDLSPGGRPAQAARAALVVNTGSIKASLRSTEALILETVQRILDDGVSRGTQNFLEQLAENHRHNLYLLTLSHGSS